MPDSSTEHPVPSEIDDRKLSSKTGRGMSWAGLSAGLKAVLQFVVLAVLARILSPADYGLMGAAIVVVGISTLFSQMGVGPALIQMKDLEPIHVRMAMTLSLIFGFATMSVVWYAAPMIELGFDLPGLAHVVRSLVLVFPIAAVSVVAEASLQRRMDFKLLCINDLSSYIIGQALVSIVLAYLGWGYMALVAGFLTQAALRTILMVSTSKAPLQLAFDRPATNKLFRFSFLFTFSQLANYVALNADNMIVARFFGASGLGLYGRAFQIVVAPAVLVGDTLDKVFFPAVSQVQDSPPSMAKIFEKVTMVLSFVILPVSCLQIILAEPVVLFLLGDQWTGVIMPLQILSVALFFRTTSKFYNAFIKATGRVSRLANYQLLYATCVIVFSLIGTRFSISGVALGVLMALVTWWFFMTGLSLQITGISWKRYVSLHREGILLTVAVGVLGWLALRGAQSAHLVPVVQIILSGAAAGVCGLVALNFAPGLRDVKTWMLTRLLSLRRSAKLT